MRIYNENIIGKFIRSEWSKTINYLHTHFALSQEDCEDVFQDAMLILHEQLKTNDKELTCSLSTYFTSICKNKAHEKQRANCKETVADETALTLLDDISDTKVDELLEFCSDPADSLIERKESLVRQIVGSLPEPCDKLLWGHFRDNYTMQTMVEMYGYSSVGYVKVTSHRCREKFRIRFEEECKELF